MNNKVLVIVTLATLVLCSAAQANTPWITTIRCIPGYDKMSSVHQSFRNQTERLEIISSVSEQARNAGSTHRVGAFGYFDEANHVVDTGNCVGQLRGNGEGYGHVICSGQFMTIEFGFNRDKCTELNGIKECVNSTIAEKHLADVHPKPGFESTHILTLQMTCIKNSYGRNMPIDSIPVF